MQAHKSMVPPKLPVLQGLEFVIPDILSDARIPASFDAGLVRVLLRSKHKGKLAEDVTNVLHRLCKESLVLECGTATQVLGAADAPPSDEVAVEQEPATKRANKKHGPQMCHYAKMVWTEIG